MKTKLLIIISFVVAINFKAKCGENYFKYHLLINKAESYYFLENKKDSAFMLYTKICNEYNFVFLKDCIIASELAVLNDKRDLFFLYLKKLFESGCTIPMLKYLIIGDIEDKNRVLLFDQYLNNKNDFDVILKIYNESRVKYINRIDKDIRKRITKMYVWDQANKNWNKNKNTLVQHDSIYNIISNKNIHVIDSLLLKNNMPLEKKIGVDQPYLFTEYLASDFDLNYWYNMLHESKEYNISKGQFEYVNTINAEFAFTILLHNKNSLRLINKNSMTLIKQGLIHPREFAFLNDFFKEEKKNEKKLYNVSKYEIVKITDAVEIDTINRWREKYYINNINMDKIKINYELKYNVKLFFGFFESL